MENLIYMFMFALMVTSVFGQKHHVQKTEMTGQKLYSTTELHNGKKQSPINISTMSALKDNINIQLKYKSSFLSVTNLGHTIQFNYQPGSTITVNNTVYNLRQFHFHTPSEHLIDGITYPLEMHIVNTVKDKHTGMEEYTVIGILFKEGEKNANLQKILDNVPENNETKSDKSLNLNINDFLNNDGNYYNYKGSLTTPPYTESVNWFVLSTILEASRKQIKELNKLEHNNARHIQSLFGRKIMLGNGL